jgi:glutamate racemase
MKLGIFDSGIGGQAVATTLSAAFPQATVLVVDDRKNIPYGDKTPQEIICLTDAAIQPLLHERCDVIVIACNTATAIAIKTLRNRYPQQRFIGIEPMIKTATGLTKSNIIAVCATPATLTSDRYRQLIVAHAQHLTILEPDCSEWAYMIEHNQLNTQHVTTVIQDACRQGADVIVLGCTHYHWIKELILQTVPSSVRIIEPSEAIAARIRHLITL